MTKGNPAHQPKALTPKMKRTVDQFIERFGDTHTNVKRADLKKAAKELLGTLAAPRWITRNMTVRTSRGMYDLSVLAKLPVVDSEAAPAPEPPAKKKAGKKSKKTKPVVEETSEPSIEEQEADEAAYGLTEDGE